MATTFKSPSKCAASSLKDMSLNSPTKPAASTSTFNPLDKSIAEHSNDDDDDVVIAKPVASVRTAPKEVLLNARVSLPPE
jgi:hypothetical protein